MQQIITTASAQFVCARAAEELIVCPNSISLFVAITNEIETITAKDNVGTKGAFNEVSPLRSNY